MDQWPRRLRKVLATVVAFAAIALFSTIVAQAVMGDRSLGNGGGVWSTLSDDVCSVASWSTFCSSQAPLEDGNSTSTSTSTSTSLSR